jgi:hypothetical protein
LSARERHAINRGIGGWFQKREALLAATMGAENVTDAVEHRQPPG